MTGTLVKLFTFSCFVVTTAAGAQSGTPGSAASVPAPSQFATAKTVFVAFAGASAGGPAESKTSATFLQDVQAAFTKSGRYTEVARPSEAELSVRCSIESTQSEVTGGGSLIYFYTRLAIFDTKTGMLLWTIDEPIAGSNRASTFYKNLNASAAKAVQDFDALAAGKLPFPPA